MASSRISDSRILTFLSTKLILSKNDREKVDPSLRSTPNYYVGGRGSNPICCSHERQHFSLGNSLQRLILAARFELDLLFESKDRALRGSSSNGQRLRVPANFDKHVYALDGGLAMALKIEEARSRGRNGHMARVFKDVIKEVKYPTEENYANEMTIELYWVGPNDGSRGFWLRLKYRHLLRGDGTLSFKKLADAVSAEFIGRVPLNLGIWDHTGYMILDDGGLEDCIDDAARRGLRDPRWRVCAEDIDASSNACLCCIYSQEDGRLDSNDDCDDSEITREGDGKEVGKDIIKTKSREWPSWTPQNSSGEATGIWEQSLQNQKILQKQHNEKVKEWLVGLPCLSPKGSQEGQWKVEARGERGKKRGNGGERLGDVDPKGVKRQKMEDWGEGILYSADEERFRWLMN